MPTYQRITTYQRYHDVSKGISDVSRRIIFRKNLVSVGAPTFSPFIFLIHGSHLLRRSAAGGARRSTAERRRNGGGAAEHGGAVYYLHS
jgi:hypothetical protein